MSSTEKWSLLTIRTFVSEGPSSLYHLSKPFFGFFTLAHISQNISKYDQPDHNIQCLSKINLSVSCCINWSFTWIASRFFIDLLLPIGFQVSLLSLSWVSRPFSTTISRSFSISITWHTWCGYMYCFLDLLFFSALKYIGHWSNSSMFYWSFPDY